VYRWFFGTIEIWFIFGFSVASLFIIYLHIRQREEANLKYRIHASNASTAADHFGTHPTTKALSMSAPKAAAVVVTTTAVTTVPSSVKPFSSSRSTERWSQEDYRHSRLFAQQALFFSLAFGLTWIWELVAWVMEQRSQTVYLPVLLLQAIFVPSLGFFDAMVYVRPRWVRLRNHFPHLTAWQMITYGLQKHVLGRSIDWSQVPDSRDQYSDADATGSIPRTTSNYPMALVFSRHTSAAGGAEKTPSVAATRQAASVPKPIAVKHVGDTLESNVEEPTVLVEIIHQQQQQSPPVSINCENDDEFLE